MIDFHSPWLAHLPRIEVKGRLARQSVRLTLIGSGAFLLLLLLLLIWQPTARSGPLYLLYWGHDRLFLPFKAYTYTIFFPTSIIWWGIATTMFLLWLLSYLSDRSLLLQPHIWLLRFAIHQPDLHPALVGFARQFKQRGIEPALLKTIAEQERALACQQVGKTTATRSDPVALWSTVRFTQLLVQLYCAPGSRLADHLAAAALWYETLLLLRVFEVATADEPENANALRLAALAACAELIGDKLPKQTHSSATDPTPANPFALEALTNDFYLTCYSQPVIASVLVGADQLLRFDQNQISGQLAQAVARRRRLLEDLRHATLIDKRRNGSSVVSTAVGMALSPQQALTAQELALSGRLAFSLALYTAYLSATPVIALSYLDAVETLRFTLAFAGDAHPADQPMRQQLSALVADAPTVVDYRLCAALQTSRIHARRQAWANSPLDHTDLILATDFDLADTYSATIMHTSGPPPMAEQYVSHERAWVGQALVQLQRLGPAYAIWQKYAPRYSAAAGKRFATYAHLLTEQAEVLYKRYGRAAERTAITEAVRQHTNDRLEKFRQQGQTLLSNDGVAKLRRQTQAFLRNDGLKNLRRQGQALYADYITSGRATAFLQEQWRQLKQFITSIRNQWR